MSMKVAVDIQVYMVTPGSRPCHLWCRARQILIGTPVSSDFQCLQTGAEVQERSWSVRKMFGWFLGLCDCAFASDKELVLYKILNHYDLNYTSVEAYPYRWGITRSLGLNFTYSDHILSLPLAMWTFPQWAMVTGAIGSICDQGHW